MTGNGPDEGSLDGLTAQLVGIGDRVRTLRDQGNGVAHILANMMEEDPLGVWDRCCAWLEREAYLLEPRPLSVRTMAWVTYRSPLFALPETGEKWIDRQIKESAQNLLDEDYRWESSNGEVHPPKFSSQKRYWFLTRTLGIPPEDAWRVCVRFNRQPGIGRKAFLAVTRDRRSLVEAAEAAGVDREGATRSIRETASSLGVGPDRVEQLLADMDGGSRE